MLTGHLLAELKAEHDQLIERVQRLEGQLKNWHANNDQSQRLEAIPGIGVLTASALAATVANGRGFSNGRQLPPTYGWFSCRPLSGGGVGCWEIN